MSFQSKERQAPVGLGRGRGAGKGREGLGHMAGLLFEPIKEEEPGAKQPINLTSLAAKISEDIRRKFNMWRLGRKVTNSWKTAPVYLKKKIGQTQQLQKIPSQQFQIWEMEAVMHGGNARPGTRQVWLLCHKKMAWCRQEATGCHACPWS